MEHFFDCSATTVVSMLPYDCWVLCLQWGAVERKPRRYDFSGYRQLFDVLAELDLKVQVVLAFHACGGNVGDSAEVPLPAWVLAAGERDPDMFYTDRPRQFSPGRRNLECISLFADEEPGILRGRSPMQCYVDFMKAFRDEFITEQRYYDCISEVVLGTGPCGELRYPSYPETNGWRFPGIGEFQCYDRRALASLARAADDAGHPEWGHGGPSGVGDYNSSPEDTLFFRSWDGIWTTEYGIFFLNWYSRSLIEHGERMLHAAASVFAIYDLKTSSTDFGRQHDAENGFSNNSEKMSCAGLSALGISNNDLIGALSGTPSPKDNSDSTISPLDSESDPGSGVNAIIQPGSTQGFGSRGPSYASFKSSSVSDSMNTMEEWIWPTPEGDAIHLNLKIAGIHWWYHTKSHAAELTAGYYNSSDRNGYNDIIALCAKYGAALTLTCVEMCDSQHPPEALCGPEGLLRRIKESAASLHVPLAGENALPCFMPNAIDESALQRIVYNTQPLGTPLEEEYGRSGMGSDIDSTSGQESVHDGSAMIGRYLPPMRSFTFLRLTPDMMTDAYQNQWRRFMKLMSRNALRFKTSERWRRDLGFE